MFGLSKQPSPPSAPPAIPVSWPPPAIAEHGPRPASLKRDTKLGVLGLRAASLAVVLVGVPIVLNKANELETLARRGTVVEGTIERLSSGTARTTKYYVDYTYAVHGVPERDQEEISSREYAHLRVGDRVPVTALPNQPATHRYGTVGPERIRRTQLQWSAWVIALAGALGVASFAIRRAAVRERAALATWRAVPAQAIRVEANTSGAQGVTYRVNYRVLLPDGRIREDKNSFSGTSSFSVKPGHFFTALLDPHEEGRSRPLYSFRLAQLDYPET
jgi:hypothetical protein